VEEERDRREESVSVGVAREGQLEHALLGRGARVRGCRRLRRLRRRLRPLERRSEPRLGSRRLARIRLAGHGVPDSTYGWEGLMKTNLVRLHKGCVEKYQRDRKRTRLNSSHVSISYAVFCLKKKTN